MALCARLRATILLAVPVLALAVASCLEIDGGAVEVAWVVRIQHPVEGFQAAECAQAEPPIATIRLQIMPDGDPASDLCALGEIERCEFSCQGKNGAGITSFDIPPGEHFFALQPISADGTPIDQLRIAVPPPTRWPIREGDLTDLGIWQIVIRNQTD